jgi:hypothetical protein
MVGQGDGDGGTVGYDTVGLKGSEIVGKSGLVSRWGSKTAGSEIVGQRESCDTVTLRTEGFSCRCRRPGKVLASFYHSVD